MQKGNLTTATFHPAISRWFEGHFSAPSPPQSQGWPAIAAGQHTLILAPTGSGKTLAAFLWCIDDLFRSTIDLDAKEAARNRSGVHTLYISPLKALNNDIHYNLQEPLKGIRQAALEMNLDTPEIRVSVRTGDTPPHLRQSMIKKPPHILITTPESLYLLLTSAGGREMFRHLRYLIVDEIHAVCNSKRGVHLSLSLERLMTLCENEPVRIGLSATQRPLERIAAFLGGQRFLTAGDMATPRPVIIVDCGQRKDTDLQVIAPIEDFSNLPEASVWPAAIEKLYGLIREHHTTLAFVNMRAQAEKIARQLNECHQKAIGDPEAEIALAHHGSISREQRYEIEARLKAGKIPAVIATASLELGIDIGSIDLVVQLESPRSVTSALQRVGRSGHLLRATSKGRIIPLYPADLDDAVALTSCMIRGEIEETLVPENCLDVLAQQIVAEVAQCEWPRLELYRTIRQSYCYRNLSPQAFTQVVEMLSGRYAENPIHALQPRLAWDKINDRLIGRRGARLLATMNGGTVPDRAYYGVYLEDGTRLGEVEEEFVFESQVGDVFFLGTNEWQINEITRDRILVTPRRSSKPRPPFWKGDSLYRDYATSIKIGAFRREFQERIEEAANGRELSTAYKADLATLQNLQNYFSRQREHTGLLPNDKQIIGEWFRDSVGEPHFLLHAPFGGRVNGAWALALCAEMEKRWQVQVQFAFDDDGVIFRLLDATEPFPVEELFSLSPNRVEELIVEIIASTPLFSIRFRQNATRALLLSRSRQGRRIPLWLQRLRAADLLQIVRRFPDFPIIVETFRDCLNDVFDLPSLRQVVEKLQRGEIELRVVHTPFPSPMASGLMFRFFANHLYQEDHARFTAQAAGISSELLAEILERGNIPAIITPEIVAAAEARWQHLAPESQAANAEDLFAVIEKLGPIEEQALRLRAKTDPSSWLQDLAGKRRIVHIAERGWITATDFPLYSEPPSADSIRARVIRLLRSRGSVTSAEIQKELFFSEREIQKTLAGLVAEKAIVHGRLVEEIEDTQWCERHNFAELYRRAIALRRQAAEPAQRETFYRFLIQWHRLGQPEQSLEALLARYAGFPLPSFVYEREILRSRLAAPNHQTLSTALEELSSLITKGQIIVRAGQGVDFISRGSGHLFAGKAGLPAIAEGLDEPAKKVLSFLQENGASLVRDLVAGTGISPAQVDQALSTLAINGLASCDDYQAFMRMVQTNRPVAEEEAWGTAITGSFPTGSRRDRSLDRSGTTRNSIRQKMQLHSGRWFLTTSFAVMGKEIDDFKRAEGQARLLLQRHGVLVKDWYRREKGLLPWPRLFGVLKRMEWQGEIRRGYFVQGLSGIQFALPEAAELLEKLQSGAHSSTTAGILISTGDPALPFGGAVAWDLTNSAGEKISVGRAASNHLFFWQEKPVLYSENYGTRLQSLTKIVDNMVDSLAAAMKTWLWLLDPIRPRRRIEIESIDGHPAAGCSLVEAFMRNGFERDGEKLVLWPSGI